MATIKPVDDMMIFYSMLVCSTYDREVGVRVLLAAGGRVATVGQLLFAPWAWAYSTLHLYMVGK